MKKKERERWKRGRDRKGTENRGKGTGEEEGREGRISFGSQLDGSGYCGRGGQG